MAQDTMFDELDRSKKSAKSQIKSEKALAAEERALDRAERSARQQIDELDRRLGYGVGAHKERARLELQHAAELAATRAAQQNNGNGKNKKNARPSGVNEKHTADEKIDKAVEHARAVVKVMPRPVYKEQKRKEAQSAARLASSEAVHDPHDPTGMTKRAMKQRRAA